MIVPAIFEGPDLVRFLWDRLGQETEATSRTMETPGRSLERPDSKLASIRSSEDGNVE